MITEQERAVIEKSLSVEGAGSYAEIAEIITKISNRQDPKFECVVDALVKLASANNLNMSNIEKISDIYNNHTTANIAALESAFEGFLEQASGLNDLTANKPNSLVVDERYTELLDKVAKLPDDEARVKAIAADLTADQIAEHIKRLRTELAPNIANHTLDPKLSAQLRLLMYAGSYQKDGKLPTVWHSKMATLAEIETRKPIRVVPGLGLMEVLYKDYQATLSSSEEDSKAAQIVYLSTHAVQSQKQASLELEDTNELDADAIKLKELTSDIHDNIKAQHSLRAEDIEYTDDKEFEFGPTQRMVVSKNEDRATYSFEMQGNPKGLDFVLSVHRVDEHGKLIPNAFDLIQYVNGEPIAMISTPKGNTAIRDYDSLYDKVNLASPQMDFSYLLKAIKDGKAEVKATPPQPIVAASESVAEVEAPKVVKLTEVAPRPETVIPAVTPAVASQADKEVRDESSPVAEKKPEVVKPALPSSPVITEPKVEVVAPIPTAAPVASIDKAKREAVTVTVESPEIIARLAALEGEVQALGNEVHMVEGKVEELSQAVDTSVVANMGVTVTEPVAVREEVKAVKKVAKPKKKKTEAATEQVKPKRVTKPKAAKPKKKPKVTKDHEIDDTKTPRIHSSQTFPNALATEDALSRIRDRLRPENVSAEVDTLKKRQQSGKMAVTTPHVVPSTIGIHVPLNRRAVKGKI
jgi:hypothetical protein